MYENRIILHTKAFILITLCLVSTILFLLFTDNYQVLAQRPNSTSTSVNNSTIPSASSVNISKTASLIPFVSRANGIFLGYPSDWMPSTADMTYPEVVRFYSPVQNVSDFVPAVISISVTRYENNVTLSQYTNFTLSLLNRSQQKGLVTIKASDPVTISGKPGYGILFTTSSSNTAYVLQMWTIVNHKLCLISYDAQPSKYVRYLPQVNQIVASLQIR